MAHLFIFAKLWAIQVCVIIYWPIPDSFSGLPCFERSSSILRTVCLSVSLGYITIDILETSYEPSILVECDKPSYGVGTLLPVLCVPATSLVLSRFPTLILYMVVPRHLYTIHKNIVVSATLYSTHCAKQGYVLASSYISYSNYSSYSSYCSMVPCCQLTCLDSVLNPLC